MDSCCNVDLIGLNVQNFQKWIYTEICIDNFTFYSLVFSITLRSPRLRMTMMKTMMMTSASGPRRQLRRRTLYPVRELSCIINFGLRGHLYCDVVTPLCHFTSAIYNNDPCPLPWHNAHVMEDIRNKGHIQH